MSEIQRSIANALNHQGATGSGRRAVLPAPVRGWNTRDPQSNMHPAFAIVLDNWFPEAGVIRTRPGSRVYADTRASADVGTLASQTAGAESRLFAFTSSGVYDISAIDPADVTSGAAPVAIPTAITSNRWRTANLNGQVIAVNGVDEPIRIDAGGAAQAHGFAPKTGYTLRTRDLTQVLTHQNRLFFTEKDSTKLWYGELRSLTGGLASIDLGLVNAAGGNLAALGTMMHDSGTGVDDHLVVITTNGTVFIYQGTDPADLASSWALRGVYYIGAPVGDKPILQLGTDLAVITVDGIVPLGQFMRGGRSQAQYALSTAIDSTVREYVREHGAAVGWEGVLHPTESWILFNAPREAGPAYQFVMNSQTKAWCRFTGMPANCWAVWKDRLFFGAASGKIWEAGVGTSDGGEPVSAFARTAYSMLGSQYAKQAHRLRAHIESGSTEPVGVSLSADYDRTPALPAPSQLGVEGGRWDIGRWNEARWGTGVARHRAWVKVTASGVAFSVALLAGLRTARATYNGAEMLYDQTTGAAN